MTFISTFFLSVLGFFNLLGINPSLVSNQLIYIVLSFLVFFLIKKLGKNLFFLNSDFFYWLFIVLLFFTFFLGTKVKGSRRWINLYFFRFQTSEFFKIFFIIFFANFFSRIKIGVNKLKYFLTSIFYFALPTFIIFKQPDLGNAMVFTFIFFILLLFSSLPKKYLFYSLLIFFLVAPFGWHFLKTYQKARIVSFLNPNFDRRGVAYNSTQAVITVGSGKFFGRGLGLGTQSKLYFLPENTTDFAYASLIEQFGFLAGFFIIIIYFLIIFNLLLKLFKLYWEGRKKEIDFFYILGIFSYLFFQVFVNIGMNMGIMPITGIALPFISYGGSSILALMIGLALAEG